MKILDAQFLIVMFLFFQMAYLNQAMKSSIKKANTKVKIDLMTCPKGQGLLPKMNHVPSKNGCGPEGDKILHQIGEKIASEMQGCCDVHDVCYETCDPNNKNKCDDDFNDCMMKKCEETYSGKIKRGLCKLKAKAMFGAVSFAGKSAFNAAQNLACTCA